MNRKVFFNSVRHSVFGGALTQPQVDGIEAILASCARHNVTGVHHISNILAQVYIETGGYMLPIKETVFPSHTNKNPSDATVITRLNRAFAKGQLTWVTKPYWRTGWFGRGPIQITHESNYLKMEKRLGVPLTKNPNLALEPNIGADIAVVGMSEGLFTGKKLSDFNFPTALDASSKQHPRRIVNGPDGKDDDVAKIHRQCAQAFKSAGYKVGSLTKPVDPIEVDPTPDPESPGTPAPFGFAFVVLIVTIAAAIWNAVT